MSGARCSNPGQCQRKMQVEQARKVAASRNQHQYLNYPLEFGAKIICQQHQMLAAKFKCVYRTVSDWVPKKDSTNFESNTFL